MLDGGQAEARQVAGQTGSLPDPATVFTAGFLFHSPTTSPSSRVITTVTGRRCGPVGLATACDSPGYLNAAPLSSQLLVNWFGRERSPGLTQKWQRR